jgi:hypothetical protein
MEPVSFLDNLVKGVILTAYDFVTLTCYGAAIPFVRNTRRFWPKVVSEQKYLSPLTYLVFWVLLTAAIALRSGLDLASKAAGFDKGAAAPDVVKTIVVALGITILADIASRLAFLFRCRGVRARLYNGLMRIAVANVFIAACALMILPRMVPLRGFESDLGPFADLAAVSFSTHGPWLPNPILILLSASLGVIFVKATSIKDKKAKWIAGVLFTIALPTLLLNMSWPMFRWSYQIVDKLSGGPQITIFPNLLICRLTDDQISITGYLSITGAKATVLNPMSLAVMSESSTTQKLEFVAAMKAEPGHNIVLSESTYTPVNLTAKYDRSQTKKELEQGQFECALALREGVASAVPLGVAMPEDRQQSSAGNR